MSYKEKNFKDLSIYFLPLAAFFLLISSAGTNFFVLLSVLTSVYYCIKNKGYKEIFEKNLFKSCFLIYLLFMLSCFYSIAENEEIFSILKKYIKFIYIPFLYYLVKIQNNLNMVIKFFILGSSLILILSYFKYYSIINFENFYNFFEYTGIVNIQDKIINTNTSIFQNYIIQGIVLSFYSFLCLYIANKDKSLLYYLLSALAFINVIFLNDSRSAYIIIILLALISLYKILTNNKGRLFFIAFCIGIMSTQFSNNFKTRIGVIKNNVNLIKESDYKSSLGYRYMWAKISYYNIVNYPILGLGVGSYKESTLNYFLINPSKDYNFYITDNPHNEFLSIASQLGFMGLILFFGFLYFLFKDTKNDILSRGTVIVVVISSIFNSAFYDNMLGLFLVILICLITQEKFSKSIEVK